jgi:uncharacterized membrane protein
MGFRETIFNTLTASFIAFLFSQGYKYILSKLNYNTARRRESSKNIFELFKKLLYLNRDV